MHWINATWTLVILLLLWNPLHHRTMISPQGKPWVTPCKTLSPRQPAGVFHLSISKNPETGKILKMQSGKQSLTTIPQGKKMIMGFQRHESPRSVQRAEPGRQPQLTCAAEQTDLSDSCKNPWTFAKLMVICLIIPDNYLLKSHVSAETINSHINGLKLMKRELFFQLSNNFLVL